MHIVLALLVVMISPFVDDLKDSFTHITLGYSTGNVMTVLLAVPEDQWSNLEVHGLHESNWQFYHKTNSSLEGRHNGRDGVSNHRRLDCLLKHLFRRISKIASKLRVTGLCEGNPPTGDRCIPPEKGQQRGKYFHLMTSSCVFTA